MYIVSSIIYVCFGCIYLLIYKLVRCNLYNIYIYICVFGHSYCMYGYWCVNFLALVTIIVIYVCMMPSLEGKDTKAPDTKPTDCIIRCRSICIASAMYGKISDHDYLRAKYTDYLRVHELHVQFIFFFFRPHPICVLYNKEHRMLIKI